MVPREFVERGCRGVVGKVDWGVGSVESLVKEGRGWTALTRKRGGDFREVRCV
jgi:hypothetical protein